jgi:hypothetical protein
MRLTGDTLQLERERAGLGSRVARVETLGLEFAQQLLRIEVCFSKEIEMDGSAMRDAQAQSSASSEVELACSSWPQGEKSPSLFRRKCGLVHGSLLAGKTTSRKRRVRHGARDRQIRDRDVGGADREALFGRVFAVDHDIEDGLRNRRLVVAELLSEIADAWASCPECISPRGGPLLGLRKNDYARRLFRATLCGYSCGSNVANDDNEVEQPSAGGGPLSSIHSITKLLGALAALLTAGSAVFVAVPKDAPQVPSATAGDSSVATPPRPARSYIQLASFKTRSDAATVARKQAEDLMRQVCVYESRGLFASALGPMPTSDADDMVDAIRRHPTVHEGALVIAGKTYVSVGACYGGAP